MSLLKITYKGSTVTLPPNIDIADLSMMFNVKPAGMHLKAKIENSWKNIWPDDTGVFDIPNGVSDMLLIASDECDTPSTTTYSVSNLNNIFTAPSTNGFTQTAPLLTFGMSSSLRTNNQMTGRGNGARAVPSFKRASSSVPVPLRKKSKIQESFFKVINISDMSIIKLFRYTMFQLI